MLNINLNKGTRSSGKPQGDGSLEREVLGNELLRRTLILAKFLAQHGNHWSIENPMNSYLFRQPEICKLLLNEGVISIDVDQCMYNLKFSDSRPDERCVKPTRIITNVGALSALGRRCDRSHQHVQAIGGYRTRSGWVKRTAEAGAYPSQLCRTWAEIISVWAGGCP